MPRGLAKSVLLAMPPRSSLCSHCQCFLLTYYHRSLGYCTFIRANEMLSELHLWLVFHRLQSLWADNALNLASETGELSLQLDRDDG